MLLKWHNWLIIMYLPLNENKVFVGVNVGIAHKFNL